MNAPMKKSSTFAGLGGILATGFDASLTDDAHDQMVSLDDIEIVAQVREEFEDDEQDLMGLGQSIKDEGQIQSLLLRPNPAGSAKPYRLVAGERRVRGARLVGLTELRARIKDMTDEQAEALQFAENIHRKNLTQIEEAKRVQRDLDQLGSVDAVLAKYRKSRAWLSKILSLLKLPEQAKRLVAENISADLEVITAVKTIEKADPAKARELVDDLKATRGKTNARERVAAVKDEVKPGKKAAAKQAAKGGSTATPRDRSQEAPGEATSFAPAKHDRETESALQIAGKAYMNVFEFGSSPKMLLELMSDQERDRFTDWLRDWFEAGKKCKDVGRAVIEGMRKGHFAPDGAAAIALVAFLHGAEPNKKFSALDALGGVKQ